MKKAGNKYRIDNKYIDILKEDWKFLVILDACRYDFFKEVYKEFFDNNNLQKAISPARSTPEWLDRIFDTYYDDIVYISGNPWINSIVVDKNFKFHAKKHFYKVVDVWDFGWDDHLGTIHPKKINKSFTKNLLKYKNKRFILHYNQPHQPYISLGGRPRKIRQERFINKIRYHSKIKTFTNCTRFLISKSVGDCIYWKLLNFFKIPSKDYGYMLYYRYGGFDEIRQAYKNDLKLVLENVKELTDYISGKWLITADHGELIGEHNGYNHCHFIRYKELVEVPFLKINSKPLK